MKKDHTIEIAGYTSIVQTVFHDIEGFGRSIPEQALAALALVNDWLQGKEIDAEALQAAANLSFEEGVPLAQREKDRALSWARSAAGNLAWLAKKDRGWQKAGQSVMDAAVYALDSLGASGIKSRRELETLFETAMKTVQPAAKKPVNKTAKSPSTNFESFIGAEANKRLAKLKPLFDLAGRGSEDSLRALLSEYKFPLHDAVLAFDARYGGLVAADAPGAEGEDWIFGAYACLKSKAHADPRGEKPDWVPVAYSPNDYILFMDERGSTWLVDTVGDEKPEKFGENADEIIQRFSNK